MNNQIIHGQLEIDFARGVIYFHADNDGTVIGPVGANGYARIQLDHPAFPTPVALRIQDLKEVK